jgi:hypothetical protein
MHTKFSLIPFLGLVRLAVLGLLLCSFSAWAGDPDPTGDPGKNDPAPPTGDPDPTGDPGKNDPAPPTGDPDPTGDPGKNDPAPPTGDPDPTGDPGKNDPAPPTGDPDPTTGESGKESSKTGKSKQDAFVPIVRTLEANAEKDGAYLFGGKILADGGSTILGAGIELSQRLNFKNSLKLSFELKAGKSNYRVKTRKLEPGSTCYYRAYVRNAAGVNVGSVKRLNVPKSVTKRGWWSEGENLGADWRRSKWFGTFRKQEGLDWVFHEKLGWVYAVSDQREGLWLWQEENGWAWTQEGAWPCLWRNKTGSWLFLMGAYEGKPVFYDYATRKVRNRPKKQDKTDKSKVTEENGRKTEQASKDKQADKVSEKTTDPSKPQENTSDRPAPGASDTDTAKLLDRIGKNNLPEDYQASRHQPYVDLVVAGLKPEQRARLAQLWKEKLRLDPDMPNLGASYVRILTHVAGEAEKNQQSTITNSKTGGNETSDSKTNGRDSSGSRNGDSSRGETTQSGDRAGESRTDDPTKADTQTGLR